MFITPGLTEHARGFTIDREHFFLCKGNFALCRLKATPRQLSRLLQFYYRRYVFRHTGWALPYQVMQADNGSRWLTARDLCRAALFSGHVRQAFNVLCACLWRRARDALSSAWMWQPPTAVLPARSFPDRRICAAETHVTTRLMGGNALGDTINRWQVLWNLYPNLAHWTTSFSRHLRGTSATPISRWSCTGGFNKKRHAWKRSW